MESIKSNGINCGWGRSKRSLVDLCFLIKDDNDNNEDIYYR